MPTNVLRIQIQKNVELTDRRKELMLNQPRQQRRHHGKNIIRSMKMMWSQQLSRDHRYPHHTEHQTNVRQSLAYFQLWKKYCIINVLVWLKTIVIPNLRCSNDKELWKICLYRRLGKWNLKCLQPVLLLPFDALFIVSVKNV